MPSRFLADLRGTRQSDFGIRPAASPGAPAAGTYAAGDIHMDSTGTPWVCAASGTPGTWTSLPNGSGAENQLAYWSGAHTLTGSATLAFSSGTLCVTGSIAVTPTTASSVYIGRIGSGNGAGEYWGVSILNAGGTDAAIYMGSASSAYQSTGTTEWVANSDAFLYYSSSFKIGKGLGSTPVMTFSSAGKVGVGTASPGVNLSVHGYAAGSEAIGSVNNAAIKIQNDNGGEYNPKSEVQFYAGAIECTAAITALYSAWAPDPYTGADLLFSTKPASSTALTERMRITSTGDVGIGMSPSAKFSVNGGALVQGQFNMTYTADTNPRFILYDDTYNCSGTIFDPSVNTIYKSSSGSWQWARTTAGTNRWVTSTTLMTLASGLQLGSPTGGDKGTGTLNVSSGVYRNNVSAAWLDAANAFTEYQSIVDNVNSSWVGALTVTNSAGSSTSVVGGQIDSTYWTGFAGSIGTNNGIAVYGKATHASGYGGYFYNSAGGVSLYVRGSAIATGGLNVGTATGAGLGQIRASAGLMLDGVTGHQYRHKLVSLSTGEVAQVATSAASIGFLFVSEYFNTATAAIFYLRGEAHAVNEISDPSGRYSTTKGAAGTINVYWDTTNARYEIQNNITSGSIYCHIFLMVDA